MTYRCGIGAGMQRLGFEPGPPHIRCDAEECTATVEASGMVQPAWLMNGTAPRGWRTKRIGEHRRDWCPKHKAGAT